MKNAFLFIYWFFKSQKHMLSTKVFVNCNIFKYLIKKKTFFYVSPNNSFMEPNLIQKPTQKTKIVIQ